MTCQGERGISGGYPKSEMNGCLKHTGARYLNADVRKIQARVSRLRDRKAAGSVSARSERIHDSRSVKGLLVDGDSRPKIIHSHIQTYSNCPLSRLSVMNRSNNNQPVQDNKETQDR
jgi:hypothetical protein